MSWHFSQALVAAYSGELSSVGELSAPLSLTSTPEAFSWPGKTMVPLSPSPSGMTCEPSTASLGEALLTSFLAGFPVRTSALSERERASTGSVPACGEKWRASLARYNQDSRSWKTHQLSLLEDSGECLAIWPRWGTMHAGECWELDTPEAFANVTASGWLPALCAIDGTYHGTEKYIKASRANRIRLGKTPPAERITFVWHEADIPHSAFPAMAEDAMGWPNGWTGLNALETGKFRQWQRSHGQS